MSARRVENPVRGTATHNSWLNMKLRCKNNPLYVERGITVCERWATSFRKFLEDMGERPDGTTLERKNNDGGYEPANCRWATPAEQSRNKKSNIMLTFRGETKCLQDWAVELRIHHVTIMSRLRKGWPVERALSTSSFHGNNQYAGGRVFGKLNTERDFV